MDNVEKHGAGATVAVPVHQRDSSNQLVTKIPHFLPHERVFPIQIGTELFKLSGASISSDGTSFRRVSNKQASTNAHTRHAYRVQLPRTSPSIFSVR